MSGDVLVEGYASLFGVADSVGDVVRAGAFSASLRRATGPPMLLRHAHGAVAGRWSVAREDGRGLYVRGLIDGTLPSGRRAADAVAKGGMDGLSIGFRPLRWRERAGGGRDLIEIELIEVSLVDDPALEAARFRVLGAPVRRAA